jgi:hypothetical protein
MCTQRPEGYSTAAWIKTLLGAFVFISRQVESRIECSCALCERQLDNDHVERSKRYFDQLLGSLAQIIENSNDDFPTSDLTVSLLIKSGMIHELRRQKSQVITANCCLACKRPIFGDDLERFLASMDQRAETLRTSGDVM